MSTIRLGDPQHSVLERSDDRRRQARGDGAADWLGGAWETTTCSAASISGWAMPSCAVLCCAGWVDGCLRPHPPPSARHICSRVYRFQFRRRFPTQNRTTAISCSGVGSPVVQRYGCTVGSACNERRSWVQLPAVRQSILGSVPSSSTSHLQVRPLFFFFFSAFFFFLGS